MTGRLVAAEEEEEEEIEVDERETCRHFTICLCHLYFFVLLHCDLKAVISAVQQLMKKWS